MSWADDALHAVTPGATSAAVYLMLAKLDRLPDVQQDAGATPEALSGAARYLCQTRPGHSLRVRVGREGVLLQSTHVGYKQRKGKTVEIIGPNGATVRRAVALDYGGH